MLRGFIKYAVPVVDKLHPLSPLLEAPRHINSVKPCELVGKDPLCLERESGFLGLKDLLLLSLKLMKLSNLMIKFVIVFNNALLMRVKRFFDCDLRGFLPALGCLPFHAEIKFKDNAIPVVFGSQVSPFEDVPSIQTNCFHSITSQVLVFYAISLL